MFSKKSIRIINYRRVNPFLYFLSIYLFIHPSAYPFIYPSIRLSIHPSTRLSTHPSNRLSIHPSTRLSIHPPIYPSILPSNRLSIHPPNPSIHPPAYPSICQSSLIISQPAASISVCLPQLSEQTPESPLLSGPVHSLTLSSYRFFRLVALI